MSPCQHYILLCHFQKNPVTGEYTYAVAYLLRTLASIIVQFEFIHCMCTCLSCLSQIALVISIRQCHSVYNTVHYNDYVISVHYIFKGNYSMGVYIMWNVTCTGHM